MRHMISALVENKFGVLVRIAGMFSSAAASTFDTLNVAPDPGCLALALTW